MSRRADLAPFRVGGHVAAIVGALIDVRVGPHVGWLTGTPLGDLPAFGRKVRGAVTRKRKATDLLTLWMMPKSQAEAGFFYLSLFSHPLVPESFLTAEESGAVREMVIALADALLAKRGQRRLSREAAEQRVAAWTASSLPPSRNESLAVVDDRCVDDRWQRRLRRRLEREDVLRRTAVNAIPPRLLLLLAPPTISR